MPRIESLKDLTRRREEAGQAARSRLGTGTTISIGMGTCGIAAGARETLDALEQELARRGIAACIATVGCVGLCAREPLLEIQQAGASRIVYSGVTAEMVPALVEEHLVHGRPVREWVLGRVPSD